MSSSKSLKRILVCLLAISDVVIFTETTFAADDRVIPEFQLVDATGKVTNVSKLTKGPLTVVCFLGTECPLARYYGPRLSGIATEYASQNVRFIGVNSNSQDSQDDIDAFSNDRPLLRSSR